MPRRTAPQARLADAALRLLAQKAWRDISLGQIARAAKLPLAALPAIVPAKSALIGLILRRLGEEVAAQYEPERRARSARERLFDAAMTWFDVLAAHKRAIRSLYDGLKHDPVTLVFVRGDFIEAAQWLMTLAEADKGPALALRAAGFTVILGRSLLVWFDDDADMTKTMARLDGDLRRSENLIGRL